MNALAAKYSCTKCEEYPVLVLTVNFSNAKASFKTDFIDKYGAKSVCVPKEDGGALFNTVLNNQNYGGPQYLICPDKSFIGKNATETTIKNKGIVAHVCANRVVWNVRQPTKGVQPIPTTVFTLQGRQIAGTPIQLGSGQKFPDAMASGSFLISTADQTIGSVSTTGWK